MKKFVKMSLVAAVAVAGLTTTSSAKDLSEAIKGVNVSGAISIGYNNYKKTADGKDVENTKSESEYDLYIKAVVPVTDNISYTMSAENDYTAEVDKEGVNNTEKTLYLKESYFTYANGATTALAGKQGVKTPWTSSVRGSGVVAMYNAGTITVAGAHFENVTLLPTDTVSAAAVIGSFGVVNASAWALSSSAGSGYSADLNGKIADILSYDVRHTTFKPDNVGDQDTFTLSKVVLKANAGIANLTLGYGMTNDVDKGVKRGSGKGEGVALNKDNGESADLYMDQARLDDYNDAQAWVIGASIPAGDWTFGAVYLAAESDDVNGEIVPTQTADVTELNVTVKYSLSKNFSVTGLYSDYDLDISGGQTGDKTDRRLELSLNYSF